MLSWEYVPHIVGGLGKHVTDLLPAIAREDAIEVVLITPRLAGGPLREQIASHIQVVRVPSYQTLATDDAFPDFVACVNDELIHAAHALRAETGSFDAIHTHDWLTAEAAQVLAQQWQVPLVATIHATEYGRGCGGLHSAAAMRIDAIERQLTAAAQRVIVCSHYMADQVVDLFGVPDEHIDIVPNAVYLPAAPFATAQERQAFRRRFAPDDEPLAFFIGRIVHEKGLHVLLAAWQRVQQQTAARLVIAGAGPMLTGCRSYAEQLGLGEQVQFAGKISDADRDRLYAVADAAIFPSLYEPFGIVALEAMAAGCPVIVSDTGGLRETVEAHETGIIVQPDHIDSLLWGIVHTLHHPLWSQARARNALHAVATTYSWPNVARATIASYQRAQQVWLPEHTRLYRGSEPWITTASEAAPQLLQPSLVTH
jgi:glycosyltransferase involved in cell wall biosynthesis